LDFMRIRLEIERIILYGIAMGLIQYYIITQIQILLLRFCKAKQIAII